MEECEKEYKDYKKESEHGDENVQMHPVLLREALAALSDKQFTAFIQAVRESPPPRPMSAEQADLLISNTVVRANGCTNVLGHAHNPVHSLTCPTFSKVMTAASWMRADCLGIQKGREHPAHGEDALYNGQLSGRYERPHMLL